MGKFKFDPEQPVIVLDVTLEGLKGTKRRVRMALDTGATYDYGEGELELLRVR